MEQIPAIEKVSKTARKLGGKKKEDFSITDQELKNASLDELRAKLAAMRAAGGIKD